MPKSCTVAAVTRARGNHTFGKPGTYHVTVTIKDVGGSATTATSTLTVTSLVAAHLKITGASATAVLAGCGTQLVAFITVVLPDQSCTQGHHTVKGTIDKHARGHVHLKISSSVGNASGDAKISRGRWQATITVPGINKDPNPPTYTIDARFNGSSGVKKGSASKRVTLEVESASGVGPGLP